MKRGLFITFEGGDGSGKSTQIGLLTEYMESQGYETVVTREPGGTAISESIRQILLDRNNSSMLPITETMLYAAARAQLVGELIRPSIEQGKVVICDRFLDSSIAYQAYGRNLGDAVQQINSYAIDGLMPDITVYLRIDPGIGRERISGREQDRIEAESEAFHRRVSDGYEALCRLDPDRIISIDASRTIEAIHEEIRGRVDRKIRELGGL